MKYFYFFLIIKTCMILTLGQRRCGLNDFRCKSGQCISLHERCNGYIDCHDGSDEERCGTNAHKSTSRYDYPSTQSPQRPPVHIQQRFGCKPEDFTCLNTECINQDLICNGRNDCTDGSDESSTLCAINKPTSTTEGFDINFPSKFVSCVLPPQPLHGNWKLHKSLCKGSYNCDPPKSLKEMQPGSYLVYSCDQGYYIKGDGDVLCGPGGKWIKPPTCEEVRCSGFNNEATTAYCTLDDQATVICNSTVPTNTKATLSCRNGYTRDEMTDSVSEIVTCQSDGHWRPKPIKCIPKPNKIKIVVEGGNVHVEKPKNQGF